MSVVRTQQLSRSYGRRRGVEDVDLEIGDGEIFGFLGPNGAGKSTTIRLLLGFLKPNSGRATIFGRDCWLQSAQIKQDVGYLPGDVRLYSWFTARKALSVLGSIRGMDMLTPGKSLAQRFLLELDVPVRRMSRGMRQKLGIILALAHRPKLVVLDEPTSGLDPLMQIELMNILREMAREGHTIFFSSHTLSEVETLCDRVAIVRDGRIVEDDSLDELRSRAHRIVELVYRADQPPNGQPLPDFLKILDRADANCRCELLGPTPDLIRWAASQPLEDISIGPPDLESLFHSYYQTADDQQ